MSNTLINPLNTPIPQQIQATNCEAKPTTLKRSSPGDGFGNHM